MVNDRLIADFAVLEEGQTKYRCINVKSKPTARRRDFTVIRKLMLAYHGIVVEVVCCMCVSNGGHWGRGKKLGSLERRTDDSI